MSVDPGIRWTRKDVGSASPTLSFPVTQVRGPSLQRFTFPGPHDVCVCTCVQACKWVYEQLKLQSAPLSPVLCTWLGCPLTDSSNNPIVRTATIPVLQKGNWRTAINLLQATQQLLGRAWMPTSKFGSVIYSWILEIQYARGGSYKKYRTWQHFEKA